MDLLRSLPIGLYLEQPQTWLHKLDPRVKFAWLMSFLTTYIFANNQWRILLVVLLVLATLTAGIPRRVWRQQMGWLLTICFLVLLIASITPDALGVKYQPRLPADRQELYPESKPRNQNIVRDKKPSSSPVIDPSATSISTNEPTGYQQRYHYVLLEIGPIFGIGPIRVTRYSFDLAIRLSTIFFTIIYGTTLYLLTTATEEITAGIESLAQPLGKLNLPITEITLTLTLSLRFIPLVLEEIQNLARSIVTRAINWRKLGWKGAVKVWLMVIEKLLDNLLLRAEQMAGAMVARGFTSPNQHRVQWYELKLKGWDWLALIVLVIFWAVRFKIGTQI